MPVWLDSLWHFIFSSASLWTIGGCIAVAIAVLMPPVLTALLPQLRTYAIATAVVCFTITSIAGKFYHDGLSVKQAQWDAANKKTDSAAVKARSDAERSIGSSSGPDGLRDDRYNRDGH
ncbi:hypothetical protein [Afipia felis]|uniref:hypothetical protein n=1 Tax=Afipia felis TaxID=1035 RepID=UPI00065F8EDD|nr:hypothetical protein [Afipia felis]